LGVLSPELLPVEAARFISGLGTLLANSKAFSRTDLLFGVSTLGLAVAVVIEAYIEILQSFNKPYAW